MLESKSEYIIFGNDADTHAADSNYSSKYMYNICTYYSHCA